MKFLIKKNIFIKGSQVHKTKLQSRQNILETIYKVINLYTCVDLDTFFSANTIEHKWE